MPYSAAATKTVALASSRPSLSKQALTEGVTEIFSSRLWNLSNQRFMRRET